MNRNSTLLLSSLALLALVFSTLTFVTAQEGEKPEPAKKDQPKKEDGEKPAAGEAADGEKKEEGDAKKEDDADAEETYEDIEDYHKLMKKMGTLEKIMRKASRDKTEDRMKEAADKIRYYASKILTTDDDEDRTTKDDYKDWAKDLEDRARELRKLTEKKKLDWDDIDAAREKVGAVCESCHKVYEEEEED